MHVSNLIEPYLATSVFDRFLDGIVMDVITIGRTVSAPILVSAFGHPCFGRPRPTDFTLWGTNFTLWVKSQPRRERRGPLCDL
jgi:hypothetical protein